MGDNMSETIREYLESRRIALVQGIQAAQTDLIAMQGGLQEVVQVIAEIDKDKEGD